MSATSLEVATTQTQALQSSYLCIQILQHQLHSVWPGANSTTSPCLSASPLRGDLEKINRAGVSHRKLMMMMMVILYVQGSRAYHFPPKRTWVFGEMEDSGSGIINVQDDAGTSCHTRKQRSFQRLIQLYLKRLRIWLAFIPVSKDGTILRMS